MARIVVNDQYHQVDSMEETRHICILGIGTLSTLTNQYFLI